RYGRTGEAARLAGALLDAASCLGHRLPEALVGTARALTGVPVVFPTACWPQAWACATPLLVLRALLRLEPGPDGPQAAPLPGADGAALALSNIPGRWGRASAGHQQV